MYKCEDGCYKNSDDRVMRMKSQPQLATRWLWSFASFVLNPFCFPLIVIHFNLLSVVLNPFETILLSFNFSMHLKKSFVLNH